ncbi:hypothetical protein PAXRUDRAFT_834601 [Paxillus rubicundulus Ve08.2h10]|uniref:Uncharacterized protein n=1 Tax=Paxillus rubicundulus Ve08.2h10 TaxID=930991 RepID=A0A0D0D420_9AGAM|nr:hypothetical protein PAXRUDRAFT_834601 [Paxillus rubicundulus Ve08.2h10]
MSHCCGCGIATYAIPAITDHIDFTLSSHLRARVGLSMFRGQSMLGMDSRGPGCERVPAVAAKGREVSHASLSDLERSQQAQATFLSRDITTTLAALSVRR